MTDTSLKPLIVLPLKVGLVGTGYAARLRAETLKTDPRTSLVAVAGHTLEKTQEFCQIYGATMIESWEALVTSPLVDLVIICTVNRDHGVIARAALEARKHVIVEYPLALDVFEAEKLVVLAQSQNCLLHVEHIELLSGVHQALKASLPQIGAVFYARYATIKPELPVPQRWSYHQELFGFPLMGALSRLHRLTDLFGPVNTVNCQNRYQKRDSTDSYYTACLCTSQLGFDSGLIAEVTYGKGETFWQTERKFEVHGKKGALILDGEQGTLIQADSRYPIEVGSRRGLFAKDTTMVLDYLTTGSPLYITPAESLYTLKVADAARRSAEEGKTIQL
ncbi:MAG: Gfo/Idh/MocA family oxidoreductase [Leptolyngbyaceae cyanobacterium HOT.MB2.61]|nr:Gfo/Idh/MocA family oxidoreductase [Leptolyngbyaceae cyanobacterium HOT.MB2.61]